MNAKNVNFDKAYYEGLAELSGDEILAAKKGKKIKFPSAKQRQESETFMKFALAAPGSDERKQIIESLTPAEETPAKEDGAATPPPEKKEPESKEPPKEPEAKGPEAKQETDESVADETSWFKKLGYDKPDRAIEAHNSLLQAVGETRRQIDKFNAERGRQGQELKRLREENSTLKEKVKAVEEPPLEEPTPPDPDKYEDGIVDATYQADFKKYLGEQQQYFRTSVERLKKEVAQKEETPPTDGVADDFSTEANKGLFEVEIPKLQKEFNLPTSVPVAEIEAALLTKDRATATPDQKVRANSFIQSLPDETKRNYMKISQAVKARYDFADGIPVQRGTYNTWAAFFIDNGLTSQFNAVKPAPSDSDADGRRAVHQQESETVTPPPAEKMAGADRLSVQSRDEKVQRLKDLSSRYREACQYPRKRMDFEASADFAEYSKLREELGVARR
jgi:hypothetical protein